MNRKKKCAPSRSLKKFCRAIILGLCALAVVSGGAVILEAFSSARRYTENMGTYTLRLYVNTLDEMLHTLQTAGRNFLSDNGNISLLAEAERSEERFTARKEISGKLAEILKLIPEADGILFWTGDESVIQANGTSFDDTLKIKEYVIKAVKQGNGEELTPNTRWSWQEIQGKSYLLSVMGISDTYCAVWLEEGILSDLSGQEPGFNLYCRQNERIIMPEGTGKSRNGSLVLEQPSGEGNFTMCMAADSYDAFTARTVYLTFFVCAIMIISFFILLRKLYREIALAVSGLTQGVEQVGTDLTVRLDAAHSPQEVKQVFDALNRMAEKIQVLQIEIYKRKIREQRLNIQFLEMQIKSHFYVNCLNIIYSMAATKKNELIQEFTLYLVDFYRYIESAFVYMIRLEEEIGHIANYVEIQKIRYPGLVEYQTVTDLKLKEAKIPPLILLTFVENIFKHAMNMSEPIHIFIEAKLQKGKIKILIRDDGKGFPENLMHNLNCFAEEVQDVDQYPGKRSGIINTICRLHMYYGDEMAVTFERKEKGTEIILLLPWKEGEDTV